MDEDNEREEGLRSIGEPSRLPRRYRSVFHPTNVPGAFVFCILKGGAWSVIPHERVGVGMTVAYGFAAGRESQGAKEWQVGRGKGVPKRLWYVI